LAEKAVKNGAECVVYGTWPKKEGHKNLEKFGITTNEMAARLDDAFKNAGMRTGAHIALVGPCFLAFGEERDLPDPYNDDRSHPSYAGSYAAALCLMNTIFGTAPETIAFNGNGELCEEDAERIKALVKRNICQR
jgi:hypothetical protein